MLSNHGGRNTIIYFNLENPFYQSLPLSLSYGHFRVNLTMTYKVVLDIYKNILDFHKNMLEFIKKIFWILTKISTSNIQTLPISTTLTLLHHMASGPIITQVWGKSILIWTVCTCSNLWIECTSDSKNKKKTCLLGKQGMLSWRWWLEL